MKESVKHVASLFAFLAISFLLSWCSVYSFWIGSQVFHSVRAVRIGDAIGSVILSPARILLQLLGGVLDQTTLLTDPMLYAGINSVLVGVTAHTICRRWIFPPKSGG